MIHLTIWIDKDLKKKFKGLALERDSTMTEMLTKFINNAVKNKKGDK